MATDLGIIKGVIELQDDFTSRLGLAEAVLSNFTKKNQESLLAIAGAAGMVTAAFGVTAAAVFALGNRGADVNDLNDTLEHFTGSATAAAEVMQKLRDGTKNTVDNFTLAKDAAQLLSARVKLTAEDFGTLGSAAFVLQNRGLGGTKEMLDLVSDALTTGRTRSLAMALGVVDAGDAEEAYAKKLGVTKDQLSQTGKIEATRIAVMELLSHAVKDAGNQERDFGEQIQAARTAVANWVDELGSAIAKSPVLGAAMKEIGIVVKEAFGSDSSDGIKTIVHWIEQSAIVASDFALGAVEMARVVNFAWSTIKTGVLSVETAIVGVVDGASIAMVALAEGLHKIGAVSDVTVAQTRGFRDSIHEVTVGLALETEEAAKGVTGHSAFDKTLDSLGGSIYRVRDAMVIAANATDENTKVTDVAASNAKKLAATQKEISESLIDRAKVETELAKIEKKSVEETSQLWNDYYALRATHGVSAFEAQKAQITAWFQDEVTKLDASDRNWKKHYDALKATADEKLLGIEVDWNTLQTKSIDYLREQADIARNTYEEMELHASHFTREALDEQLKKVHETEDAARGMGKAFVDAETAAADATKKTNDELKQQQAAAKAAHDAMMAMGGSMQYDLSTDEGRAKVPADIAQWLHDGYSFEQAAAIAYQLKMTGVVNQNDPIFAHKGPRVPGFAEGGTVAIRVGENGPETMRVPLGTQVYPTGMQMGGGDVHNTFYVNGTAIDVANKIKTIIMNDLKMRRQFGST